jgi:hypothetical protein
MILLLSCSAAGTSSSNNNKAGKRHRRATNYLATMVVLKRRASELTHSLILVHTAQERRCLLRSHVLRTTTASGGLVRVAYELATSALVASYISGWPNAPFS